MAAHRMSDSDRLAYIEVLGYRDEVGTEVAPTVRRRGPAAAAVTARVDREAPALGEMLDDAVPAAAVEAGRMREEKRRARAGPIPDRELLSVGAYQVKFGASPHTPTI